MNLKHCATVISMFCILICGTSCININEELGSNFIPTDQRYDIYIDEFPLTEIAMQPITQLSGYNSSRVTIGAIMAEDGSVTTRSSAFSLIPATEYDFGEGGEVVRFHFAMAKDTLSFINESQKRILQDINIYALEEPLEDGTGYISTAIKKGERIADVATYDGGDSLSFDFKKEWADWLFHEKLQKMEESAYDSVAAFTSKVFPGIYIDVDEPASAGGRINMFSITTGADLEYYTLEGGYATLTVRGAVFDGKETGDTTFMFLYGAQDFSITQEAVDYYSGETITPQYALNVSTSTLDSKATDKATTEIIVDGGGGLKPVIRAKNLKDEFSKVLEERGIDPASVIINKASLILPFDMASDYDGLNTYPAILSPTCKIYANTEGTEGEEIVSFAGITDTSSSSENQGDINRSTFMYSPDISYHMQQILALDDYDDADADIVRDYEEKDIWLMTLAVEQQEEQQEGTSEYYNNLYYSMYYNNLYNYGGYGYGYGYGYGGYGSYGYGNYYDYYAMAAYYSAMQSSQTSENSTTILDRDRYYKAVLRGPESNTDESASFEERRVPYVKITYSVKQK